MADCLHSKSIIFIIINFQKFNFNLLARFPWLEYSKFVDGCFCVPCLLFGMRSGHNSGKLSKLFTEPLTLWTSAASKLRDHEEKSKLHQWSVLPWKTMENKSLPVHQFAYKGLQNRIRQNREKLKPILKTVILCGQENIPLQGHRDDSQHYSAGESVSKFQRLLDFRIDSGDKVLENHFRNAPRNATYRSKTVQNELIEYCGEHIRSTIIQRIKDASFYSILADEAQDVSNMEQIPLVLRYVDSPGVIREDFIKFVHCKSGISGAAISDSIKSEIRSLGLTLDNCRGQGYDGAGNMAGRYNGAAALIKNDYPKALYVHCASHRLNLCVTSSCKIVTIKNMMSDVKAVSDYFNSSPKLADYLKTNIVHIFPKDKHTKLIDLCRTRWIERLVALDRFQELYEAIMITLENIYKNIGGGESGWNEDSKKDASALFHTCSDFGFIITLVIV